MRILVVEDEAGIRDFLVRALEAEGHAVTALREGQPAAAEAAAGDYALVLLDLGLPDRDGLEVLDEIRLAKPALPIIVVTARGAVQQRVEGLDRGASDYVTKPFSLSELLARVRAQLRTPSQAEATALTVGEIALDLRTRRATRGGREVGLTAREFELLTFFMRHPGQVLSREQILSAVWGYDFDPGTNVLEVYVGYLRRKLSEPEGPDPIETIRSVGYRFDGSAR